MPVTRLGGTASTFALSNNAGSTSFSLPAGSDRLVAMISLHSTTTSVTSMTWKPDPGNPALNQPLTLVGRQVASASGAVEIWELANPTPGVAGAALSHTLSANAKRVIGVHALAGVGGHGTPVGAGINGNAISVNVPSQPGALVLDVLYGQNSTTAHTAGAGQTEHWSLNRQRHQQPARRRLIRGRGGHDDDELDVRGRHPPRPPGGQLQPSLGGQPIVLRPGRVASVYCGRPGNPALDR